MPAPGSRSLTGPTAGYLASFPLCALLAGRSTQVAASRTGGHPIARAALLTVFFFGVHLILLAIGSVWLAHSRQLEASSALESGFTPFLLGAAVKSALAAGLVLVSDRSLS